jgi:hypothetical protein
LDEIRGDELPDFYEIKKAVSRIIKFRDDLASISFETGPRLTNPWLIVGEIEMLIKDSVKS